MELALAHWQEWFWSAGILAGAALVALVLVYIAFSIAERAALRTSTPVDEMIVRRARKPAMILAALLAIVGAVEGVPLSDNLIDGLQHAVQLGLIGTAAWLAIRIVEVIEDVIELRYPLDDLNARRVRTQYQVLHRIAIVLIGVAALASMLMTFPTVWRFGAGLFASAGVAGVVLGLAARPVLENLLAGIQLAITEPIRIGDAVIVEGEWGIVEEIGAAFVVVKIWDMRRMIVPLAHFIQKPFQNWTRSSTQMLGTVFFHTDFSVSIDDLRKEYKRILDESGMWDGSVWNLQVTNMTENSIEIRAVMSAPDSGKAWDLRCHVREKLVAYLQQRHPDTLPRNRTEFRMPAAISE